MKRKASWRWWRLDCWCSSPEGDGRPRKPHFCWRASPHFGSYCRLSCWTLYFRGVFHIRWRLWEECKARDTLWKTSADHRRCPLVAHGTAQRLLVNWLSQAIGFHLCREHWATNKHRADCQRKFSSINHGLYTWINVFTLIRTTCNCRKLV